MRINKIIAYYYENNNDENLPDRLCDTKLIYLVKQFLSKLIQIVGT